MTLLLLKGSWDLVTGAINRVTTLFVNDSPIEVLTSLHAKSQDRPSSSPDARKHIRNPPWRQGIPSKQSCRILYIHFFYQYKYMDSQGICLR